MPDRPAPTISTSTCSSDIEEPSLDVCHDGRHGGADQQAAAVPAEPGMSSATDSGPTVDVAWIAAHLEDPRVQLIEVDVSPAAYAAGHIPGAILWNAYADLRDPSYRTIALTELEGLLCRAGITPATTLVFHGYGAALGFWLMEIGRA